MWKRGNSRSALRIDSPGGTVGDSQEIHSALLRPGPRGAVVGPLRQYFRLRWGLHRRGSGIDANPGTITGSIESSCAAMTCHGSSNGSASVSTPSRVGSTKTSFPLIALSPEERALLQELIDSSYGQFVRVVAEGRSMTEEAVRGFADGRVFSGEQAKTLGLVDELGDEDHPTPAARLADLDEQTTRPVTLGRTRKTLMNLLPGSQLIALLQQRLSLELMGSGQVLWLYRP